MQTAVFIGAGGISRVHMRNLVELGIRIGGVFDIDERRAAEKATEFGGRHFSDLETMLDSVDCDVAFICTPPTARLEAIRAVCSRKIPCFMEKPPAFDLQSAMEIQRMVESAGIVHAIGFMWRWSKGVEACKRLLRGKTVTFVRSSYLHHAFGNPTFPRWFLDKSRSGGPILDQAIHIIDLCRYLLGELSEVYAMGNRNILSPFEEGVTAEESVVSTLRYQSGVIQSHSHSWAHKHGGGSIDFYTGDLRISLDLGGNQDVTVWSGRERVDGVTFDENRPYLYEVEALLRAIRSGNTQIVRSPISDSVKTLEAALTLNQSMEMGRPVTIRN